MAVRAYQSDTGQTLWKAYVCVRSKVSPEIRVQRHKFGCKTQKQGEREETQLLLECQKEVLNQEARGSSWGAVVESFEKYLNSSLAETLQETTRQDYIATIRIHTSGWWDRPASAISTLDLKELFAQVKAQGISIAHARKMKYIINRMFVFGMENGMIKGLHQSPTNGIQFGRGEEKKPEILTIVEIRRLLKEARKLKYPWYPVWALALLTGMRSGELYALLWTDVDWVNNSLMVDKSYNGRLKCIKGTKAGYYRTIPISSELKALLQEIKATAGDRPSILPRMWKWTIGFQAVELRKFCIGIGLPSIRFHALRACFATQLIRNGVPPIQIQKICGWRDLKTMQRYIRMAGIEIEGATENLHVLPEMDAMSRANAFLPPKTGAKARRPG